MTLFQRLFQRFDVYMPTSCRFISTSTWSRHLFYIVFSRRLKRRCRKDVSKDDIVCLQEKYPQQILKTWVKLLKNICECAHFSISDFNPETLLKNKDDFSDSSFNNAKNTSILNPTIQYIFDTKRSDVTVTILWKIEKLENPFTILSPPWSEVI